MTRRISGEQFKNGTKLVPGAIPQILDSRILLMPFAIEVCESFSGVGLVDRGVNRPQILRQGRPVPFST